MDAARLSPPQAWLVPSQRAVHFPAVFQAVKSVVRNGNITDETRGMLKGWLKSNDCLLVLLSLTVRVHSSTSLLLFGLATYCAMPELVHGT